MNVSEAKDSAALADGAPQPLTAVKPNEYGSGVETFHAHRSLLISIAYRMLGSLADAEDMVQEAFLRWQQSTQAAVESPRAFLVTIVSRLCIDHLKSARTRREQYVGPWLPEPFVSGPQASVSCLDPADDSLSIAFLMLLERLNPVERAVFLLREIFDYEYREIASILRQSEPSCRQILRRARQRITENRPRFHPSAAEREKLFQQFLRASSRGDVEGLISILHQDVILYADGGGKTFAVPRPVYGAEKVMRFLVRAPRKFLPKDLVRQVVNVNGQPAVLSYLDGRPHSVLTAEISGRRIRNLYIISNPEKLSRLPAGLGPMCAEPFPL
jgi:RNA polymerase sigma-70 factor (ECF subfamily)